LNFIDIFGANITTFQSTISGHFFKKKSRDADIQFSWESEVYILLVVHGKSLKKYLGLHPNDQTTRFLPFSIRSIILASGRNRKLKCNADKQSDTTVLSLFALRFSMIP
jgi:hypothetical protein